MRSCIKLKMCYSDYHLKYAAKGGECGKQRNIQQYIQGFGGDMRRKKKTLSKGKILIRIL